MYVVVVPDLVLQVDIRIYLVACPNGEEVLMLGKTSDSTIESEPTQASKIFLCGIKDAGGKITTIGYLVGMVSINSFGEWTLTRR